MTTKTDTAEKCKLTPQQEVAVDLLATGKTITAVAEAIETSRQTVSEWLNHNPAFQAELNRRRQELWQAHRDRLASLAPKAIDILECALEGPDSLKAAMQILRAAGLHEGVKPSGPTEPEDIEIELQRRRDYSAMEALALLR